MKWKSWFMDKNLLTDISFTVILCYVLGSENECKLMFLQLHGNM